MSNVPFGNVVFRAGTQRVQALITPGVAKVVDGYAKYNVVGLEQRTSLLEYAGRDPRTMQVPILLDGFRKGISQEAAIRALEAMCMPPNLRGSVPPRVIAEGSLPILGAEWAMTITWGDDVIMNPRSGVRTRQDAMVTLMEHSADQLLVPTMLAASGVPWVEYRVQKGDTIAKLAARYSNTPLGRAWYRREVLKKNGLRAGAKLPKTIKVPK